MGWLKSEVINNVFFSSVKQIRAAVQGFINSISKVGGDISWSFEVDSLDKALALVKEKGIKVDSDPIQPTPHIRFFFIKDPNGMKIQLAENIA